MSELATALREYAGKTGCLACICSRGYGKCSGEFECEIKCILDAADLIDKMQPDQKMQ